MGNAGFIDHNGSRIFFIDFRGCNIKEVMRVINDARKAIAQQPEKSVRVLTDITDAHYDNQVADALKTLALCNKPFVKASAVVGVVGIRRIVFQSVRTFSKRDLELFDTQEQAKEWLSKQ